jgi:hypothetical protein
MSFKLETPSSILRRSLLTLALASFYPGFSSADDEKLAKQLGKLDAEFVKALTELAKKFDKDTVPEAAHFFASCALGFGSKDETLSSIKASHEASVYLGRLRGGEPLKETALITSALGGVSTAYKKILDPWIALARKGALSDEGHKLMLDTGVKYEISRGAHEYVQAIQRFNALRKAMHLRAVLWDSDESRHLILAAWYTGETEDRDYENPKHKDSPFYSPSVGRGIGTSWGMDTLREYPDVLRSYALVRQDLLNPNARQLRLAHWGGGKEISTWAAYSIPQLPYRTDIPTPTQRFKGETVVQDWVEVEDTVESANKKIPIVRYPYPKEQNAPRVFSNGRGAMESGGWAKSEHNFLEKAGVPIMFRFFLDCTFTDVSVELSNSIGTCPCRIYQNGDARIEFHRDFTTILLLPERPLEPALQHTVTIKGKLNGSPFEGTWSFTTRSN